MPLTKQTIAVIGADSDMGSVIAKSISGGNYRLLLLSKDVSNVQPVAEDIIQSSSSADVSVMDCQYNACWEADIIIIAVPYSDQEELAEKIEKVATQKIVITFVDPVNKTIDGSVTSREMEAAEELQEWLPNSKVVKISGTDFTQSITEGKRADMIIADGEEYVWESVSELLQAAGFIPILAGDLSTSRTPQ